MSHHSTSARHGFTMVEMLMVVTLIALVSSIAIVLYNGAVKDSAESISIATQKQLTNEINAFSQLHGQKLADGFDSLMRDVVTRPYTGTWTTVGGLQVADNPKDLFYVGYDVVNNTTLAAPYDNVADPSANSKGLDTWGYTGAFRGITVAQLTTSDVTTLNSLGLYTVQDISVSGDFFHGNVSYVTRTLKAGDPVCIIDPTTTRNGKSMYSYFGIDLSNTTSYPTETANDSTNADYPKMVGDLNATGRSAAISKQRFLVFGIGSKCKLIGDRKGGLQEAPQSSVVVDGSYNKYMLVIKMPGGPNDMSPAIAGILDPKGATVQAASSWATRTE